MNRVKTALLLIALLPLACPSATLAAAKAGPNVLIIHTDEHNFRTLGCYRKHPPKEQAFVWGEGVTVETAHIDGPARPGWTPKRQFGFADNQSMFNRRHGKRLEDSESGPRVKGGNNYRVQGADEQSFTTDFLADKAVAFIEAHKDQPFCFLVSIPDPHGPNSVRPPCDTMYEKFRFQRPASSGGRGPFENLARYLGMVKCIDDNVGKLLATLRNLFSAPASRETVRELARALADYAQRFNEPFAAEPAIGADLNWCAEGSGSYAAPKRTPRKPGATESDE